MDFDLSDRAYLLTGASRGLGRATAEALVAGGARVVVSGRHRDSLDETVAALNARAGQERAIGVVADNADPAAAERLVGATVEAWGRLDGVLVSVGGPPGGSVLDTPDEAWTSAFESVFLGAVRLARVAAASMGSGGSIALVLSTSVRAPVADLAISNGLRPGLAMVAKTLAGELGGRGIRVNALLPGRIATDRVAELDEATGDAEAARARAVAGIPLGRYGEPREFGAAAAFLLSPASSFVNGVMLPVDGGMLQSL